MIYKFMKFIFNNNLIIDELQIMKFRQAFEDKQQDQIIKEAHFGELAKKNNGAQWQ